MTAEIPAAGGSSSPQARGVAEPFRRPPGRRAQQAFDFLGAENQQQGIDEGRLPHAGTAGDDQHAALARLFDRLLLARREFRPRFFSHHSMAFPMSMAGWVEGMLHIAWIFAAMPISVARSAGKKTSACSPICSSTNSRFTSNRSRASPMSASSTSRSPSPHRAAFPWEARSDRNS